MPQDGDLMLDLLLGPARAARTRAKRANELMASVPPLLPALPPSPGTDADRMRLLTLLGYAGPGLLAGGGIVGGLHGGTTAEPGRRDSGIRRGALTGLGTAYGGLSGAAVGAAMAGTPLAALAGGGLGALGGRYLTKQVLGREKGAAGPDLRGAYKPPAAGGGRPKVLDPSQPPGSPPAAHSWYTPTAPVLSPAPGGPLSVPAREEVWNAAGVPALVGARKDNLEATAALADPATGTPRPDYPSGVASPPAAPVLPGTDGVDDVGALLRTNWPLLAGGVGLAGLGALGGYAVGGRRRKRANAPADPPVKTVLKDMTARTNLDCEPGAAEEVVGRAPRKTDEKEEDPRPATGAGIGVLKRAADLSPGSPARADVPKTDFALPKKKDEAGGAGSYPVSDKAHARAALGFAAMHHGKDSATYKAVRAKVDAKFGPPKQAGIGVLKRAADPPPYVAPPAQSGVGQFIQRNAPGAYAAGHQFLNQDVGGAAGTGASSGFVGGVGDFLGRNPWATAGLIGAPIGAGIGLLGGMGSKRKRRDVLGDALTGAALGGGAGVLGGAAYDMLGGDKPEAPAETPAAEGVRPPGVVPPDWQGAPGTPPPPPPGSGRSSQPLPDLRHGLKVPDLVPGVGGRAVPGTEAGSRASLVNAHTLTPEANRNYQTVARPALDAAAALSVPGATLGLPQTAPLGEAYQRLRAAGGDQAVGRGLGDLIGRTKDLHGVFAGPDAQRMGAQANSNPLSALGGLAAGMPVGDAWAAGGQGAAQTAGPLARAAERFETDVKRPGADGAATYAPVGLPGSTGGQAGSWLETTGGRDAATGAVGGSGLAGLIRRARAGDPQTRVFTAANAALSGTAPAGPNAPKPGLADPAVLTGVATNPGAVSKIQTEITLLGKPPMTSAEVQQALTDAKHPRHLDVATAVRRLGGAGPPATAVGKVVAPVKKTLFGMGSPLNPRNALIGGIPGALAGAARHGYRETAGEPYFGGGK